MPLEHHAGMGTTHRVRSRAGARLAGRCSRRRCAGESFESAAADSKPGLFLVPECEYVDRVICRLVPVQRDVAEVSETDHQFTQFRLLRKRPAHLRMGLQQREVTEDGLGGALCSQRAFFGEEYAAAFHAQDRTFGDDYPWHSGSAVSAGVPQVSSQALTCSRVRWRPVSW